MSVKYDIADPKLAPKGKSRIEWAGNNLATVFGQKRNLVRRDFWRMLSDIPPSTATQVSTLRLTD